MAQKSVLVTPKGKAWKVQTAGSKRAAKITATQEEAIQIGRRIAMNNGYELVIYRRGGVLQSQVS